MQSLLWYALEYMARDEAGAELPEWTIWVAVLALIGAALVAPVQAALLLAFTTVLAGIPGVS